MSDSMITATSRILRPIPMEDANTGDQIISNLLHDTTTACELTAKDVLILWRMQIVQNGHYGEAPNFYVDANTQTGSRCCLGQIEYRGGMQPCLIVNLSHIPGATNARFRTGLLVIMPSYNKHDGHDKVIAWILFNDSIGWRQVM